MFEKSSINGWQVLIIVLILASTLLIISQMKSSGSVQGARDTIQVSGSSDLSLQPDQAEISIAVQTDAGSADTAQVRNKALMGEVIKSLKTNGLEDAHIETTSYNLQKKERYNPQTGQMVTEGYTASHLLKVTVKDLEMVGKIADDAVTAGANRIDNIQFSLSKEAQEDANELALGDASKNAQKKAKAIAKSLGVKLGKAISISETNFIYQPYISDFKMGVAESAPEPSIIPPKEVSIQLQVNVVYEIY